MGQNGTTCLLRFAFMLCSFFFLSNWCILDLQKFHNICTFGLLHVWAVVTVPRQNWTFQNKIEQAFPHHVTIPLNLG
jgi:hypothetical protein